MSANISIVNKETHQRTVFLDKHVVIKEASVIEINVKPSDIVAMEKQGNSLVIKLKSGESIFLEDFYVPHKNHKNSLVLQHDNELWVLDANPAGQPTLDITGFSPISSIQPLLLGIESGISSTTLLGAGLGALLIGGGIALASSNGGSDSNDDERQDVPPAAPVISNIIANADGTLSVSGVAGAADPGSTVTVIFPDGSRASVLVAADGSYGPVTSSVPQTSGTISVIDTDAAGNSSPAATASYSDTTAPVAPATPSVVVNPDGTLSVSGSAEPGTTVTITFPDGSTATGP